MNGEVASVGTCNGCGVEIMAIVGAAWKVTVTTPEGRTVGPQAFCLSCMSRLAVNGVKLLPTDPTEQSPRRRRYSAIGGVDGHTAYYVDDPVPMRVVGAFLKHTCECGATFDRRKAMTEHHDAMRAAAEARDEGAKS